MYTYNKNVFKHVQTLVQHTCNIRATYVHLYKDII